MDHITFTNACKEMQPCNLSIPVSYGSTFLAGLNTSLDKFAEFNDPLVVAVSDKIRFRNWNEPLQGHLALTGDPTEMM